MSIRKEQALFLAALALGGWYVSSFGGEKLPKRVSSKKAAAPDSDGVTMVLAAANPDAQPVVPGPDREPSESSPLPPRDLPRIALATLPVVLPPLDPGPGPGSYHLQRASMVPVEPMHEFQAVDDVAAVVEATTGPVREAAGADRIEFVDGNRLDVVVLNENKIELAQMSTLDTDIRYHWISVKEGGRIVQADRVAKPGEVARLVLASSRENWAATRAYELRGGGPQQVPARKEFVLELLALAPAYPEFFAMAETQADKIVESSVGAGGYRWLQRVLRAQGDLEREWALYAGTSVPANLQGTSFLHRGKGEIEAMLGLWTDAESDLRKAVEAEPRNARSNAALARFLLQRGDAAAAEPFANAAVEARGTVQEADDKFAVGVVQIETLLALGRLDDAQSAVRRLSAGGAQAAELAYLRGAVDYARGDFDAAQGHFRESSAAGTEPRARLGLGYVALATKQWDQARLDLETVARSAPILRARALTGLGFLYLMAGHAAEAEANLEAARLAAPNDAYTLYLEGHRCLLIEDYEGAIQSHRRALAERDDLVESLSETCLALRAQSGGATSSDDPAALLARAARYADRAVQLDATRGKSVLLTELQGQVKFALRDMAGARDAFTRALEAGSDVSLIGLATIDYEQGRAIEARDAFVALGNDTTRPADVQAFARMVVDLIDDHADKELVRDAFDRDEVGQIWTKQRSDRAVPRVEDGRLVIEGPMKATPAYVRRSLDKGGFFLKAGTTMQVTPTSGFTFAGIKLSASGRGSANRFSMRLGVNALTQGLQPYLSLNDGRKRENETQNHALEVPGFDPTQPQRIEVEVQATGKPNSLRFVVRWNDQEVFSREELRSLRPNSSYGLDIDLMAEARGAVNVAFDDFLLHRRQPK